MSAIILPTSPIPREPVTPRLIRRGGDVVPLVGGKVQRMTRLGSRWGCDVVLPMMRGRNHIAKEWLTARFRSENEGLTLRYLFPLPHFVDSYGSLVINGASQTGSTLAVTGGRAGAVVKSGHWFNVVVGSALRLYYTVADTILNGSGAGTLSIAPMLRQSPDNSSAVSFSNVTIEGFMDVGGDVEWSLSHLENIGVKFTIAEDA